MLVLRGCLWVQCTIALHPGLDSVHVHVSCSLRLIEFLPLADLVHEAALARRRRRPVQSDVSSQSAGQHTATLACRGCRVCGAKFN